MFYSKLLASVADSIFWVIIIITIALSIWFLFRGICSYLLEDLGSEEDREEERQDKLFKEKTREKTQSWAQKIIDFFKRKRHGI